MRALQIGAHEAAVPERGTHALMAKKPSHLVQTGAASQPARRGEVAESVRMEAVPVWQASLAAEPMKNLRQVPVP